MKVTFANTHLIFGVRLEQHEHEQKLLAEFKGIFAMFRSELLFGRLDESGDFLRIWVCSVVHDMIKGRLL